MSPAEFVRLRVELARDRKAIEALIAEAQPRFEEIQEDDVVSHGYVALTVHRFYTACEAIFERIARECEGNLPVGADSHQALLDDMGLELPSVRPAVLRDETAHALRPLLRFRHFVRHAYAVRWDPERLRAVAGAMLAVWPLVDADLVAFDAFLSR
jgi:hypothetical protein